MRMPLFPIILVALAAGCARTVDLKPGTTEVVVAPDAPTTVRFAADEMTNLLSKTFGKAVPLVTAPTAGRQGIYLGANDWTRRAGIDVAGLKRDGFTIVAKDGNVYIAGRDDEKVDFYRSVNSLRTGVWDLLNEHATLFGAYEFLERFARVRLYFPGELGTIVPRLNAVEVPEGSLTLAPDYTTRKYSWYPDGVYFEGTNRTAQLLPERKINYVRNRMETIYMPCCHGSNGFRIQSRFAKEHPEYMILFKKGGKLVRDLDPKEKSHHPGQICHSSAVYDEFFKDICSYARGDGPEVRGMGSWKNDGRRQQDWAVMTFRKPWVDIMPQDGMQACQCEKCQAAYNKKEFHYATELIWGRTVELANRLKQAGVDIRLTQMAYTPYRRIPDIDIPDNVDVMVAEGGPWSVRRPETLAKEYEEISGWAKKLKRPVWIWTYPGKYGQMDLPNVPDGTPRAWGKYYKETAKWSFGAFAESGGDRAFYNYLCYYVFGKVCWDNQTDVDALLDEYFRLMFGPAAKEMAALVDDVERLWLDEVAGKSVETDLGPQRVAPSPYDLYVNIYSDKTMARWDAWLRAAAAKVADGSLEARRIALYRQEYYDPLMKARTAYCDAISVEKEVANRAAHPERKNLLVNGDFSETMKCSSDRHFGIWQKGKGPAWQGGWIAGNEDGPQISFHGDVPKGVKGKAMKIVGNGKVIGVGNHFVQRNGRLKPGQRYRVSYFVRLTDVVPQKPKSGVCMRVWCDHNTFFPHNHMTGTTGWIHQSFEFTAGPKSGDFENAYQVYLWNSTGTVEYADLRLEEL